MNKISDVPVSRKAIRGRLRNNYIKYLGLPLIYIIVIFMVVPSKVIELNTYTMAHYDSYRTAEISNDTKLNYILKKYSLTKDEFNVLCAIVLSEAEGNSYEDAYAVINTIYNRTHAKNWVRSVNGHFGKGKGTSMYYQAISPSQFTVYSSGSYKRHLNETNSVGYKAILDFLYSEQIMHNYLSFRSHSIKVASSESFSKNGNNYFNVLKETNKI